MAPHIWPMTDMLENWRPDMIKARTRTPFTASLGAEILVVEAGQARLRLPFADHILADVEAGEIHSGAVGAMLDQACGLAIISALPGPAIFVTVDLRIDHLRPARARADMFFEARCFDATREIMFLRAFAYEDNVADPFAVATGNFMFTQMPQVVA